MHDSGAVNHQNPELSSFLISKRAAMRLKDLGQKKGRIPLLLRIEVKSGGCFGFKYGYDFEACIEEGDLTIELDGATVIIDPASLAKIQGGELDYAVTLGKEAFEIRNPQAVGGCGCGNSFAVNMGS